MLLPGETPDVCRESEKIVTARNHCSGSSSYTFGSATALMPGASAEEFLAFVKAHSPMTKVVLITAAERAGSEAERLKIKRYIGKPFTDIQLLAALA